MTTQFKSLKWCYTNDSECQRYEMYCPDGDRIIRIQLTGSVKLLGVYLSNKKFDVLKTDTQIQIEKIKKQGVR